ncbi:FRAS1-related extracellular matrix protein 1-like [Amphiura filiformis]|uniref:FRAS1-related extracellular matrix protein 1-like n=1 Tax=Amphiura filiformis TaxID=82378 RepID=UPI003B226420
METCNPAMVTAFLFAVLTFHSSLVIGQLVVTNRGLNVPIGRSVYVDPSTLYIEPPLPGEVCKVEVAVQEPFYQRVGRLEPQVFDCHYYPNSVQYIHTGSPMLDFDIVKARIYKFTATETVKETIFIFVNVTLDPYRSISPMMPLEVDEFFGRSDPLDVRVVDFIFDRWQNASCRVRMNSVLSGWPRYGQLIKGENAQQARAVYETCDDFHFMNIRYEHLIPPTPNIDFIVLTVEVDDPTLHHEPFEERYFHPVVIVPGFPNQPPTASFSSAYVMEADQFIMTTITPEIMSGSDGETASDQLVFFISQPLGPGEGSIVHLDDHTKDIESFSQQDLNNLNIAYKPPSTSDPERRVFEVVFQIADSYFQVSQPIRLLISVRASNTNGPRVSTNTGLTLLEGQSRPIRDKNLAVVDNDNLFMVRLKIVGGLHHGRLLVNNRPAIMFSPFDIQDGVVVYHHDGSDTKKDSVELRITDGRDTVRTTLPINILPIDNNPPSLITNIQIEVDEGKAVKVTRFMLLASDKDSNDDYIIYRITRPPAAGEILKKFSEDSYGYPVTEFTQRDLFRGLLYYQHLGQEIFDDSFDLVLLDSHVPPNISPTQTVMIKVNPVNDIPPKAVSGLVLSITVPETDIAFITRENLQYTDSESPDDDLQYTITTPPHFIATQSVTDAGRIYSAAGVIMPMKDQTMSPLQSFQQRDINQRTIAYMPPFKEIGPNPREVQFVYSVSDPFGNVVVGNVFDITVTPVNDKPPVIYTNDLTVNEGGDVTISPTKLSVTDMDTLPAELVITLWKEPSKGRIVVGGENMTIGGTFTMEDITANRVRYVHYGSEDSTDQFEIIASDGAQQASQTIHITILPINDQIPQLVKGLVTQVTIHEGEELIITPDILLATDVDTNDMLLHFIVVKPPKRGILVKNGVTTTRFRQMDITEGFVKYRHASGETGDEPVYDEITFIVSDKSIPTAENLPVHDLRITILPIDNQAPRIVFGNPYFVNEGSKEVFTLDVLSAVDRDTALDELTFYITEQPEWGFVENILPKPGFEKSNAGKPITFFTFEHLRDGYINYVQSIHEGFEPRSDSLILYVTDGQHYSANVTFIINIIPQNDEIPVLTIQNFTIFENSFFKITTEYIDAFDFDVPMEMLVFSIVDPPQHGMLVDRALPEHVRLPIFDFNLNQLQNTLKFTYEHDGSETTHDRFSIRVTDGKHTVRKPLDIEIIPVDDMAPRIIKNTGITVSLQDYRVMSAVILQSTDLDTPDTHLYYVIKSYPRRGVLQRYVEGVWKDLSNGGNFTQEDLNMNLIRYLHTSELGSKGLDRFRFDVTDGVRNTGKESVLITIKNTRREPLRINNYGLELREGERKIIPIEQLSAYDNSNNLAEIQFTVTTPPAQGHVERIGKIGYPVTAFTQLDLTGQQIVYNHLRIDQVQNDQFTFSVTNGLQVKNDTFHVVVIPIDDQLPVLTTNVALNVPQNGYQVIKPTNLEAVDQDTFSTRVEYVITQPPLYGQLLKGGLPIEDTFTQADIDNGDIVYRHMIEKAAQDEFYFNVFDGTNVGYVVNNLVYNQPLRYAINIELVDNSPPRLVAKVIPNKLEVQNGRYAYTLSDAFLRADDECNADSVVYSVVAEPLFGHFENVATRRRVQGKFTQQDVNDRIIKYIMRDSARVTNDSFTFDLWDCNENALRNQRFEFRWSIILFNREEFMVCETMGTLSIGILRVGNLLMSSFVGIESHSLTAKEGLDFAPNRANQIQFDPGVSQAVWTVDIIPDDLEENRERFKVMLSNPVNAVLGEYDQVKVVIKDSKDGACRGEEGPGGPTITGTQTCCGPDGLPYSPDGGPLMPELPPGVPQPGQPLLPGMHPDEQVPGMPHLGPNGPYLGPVIPPQDMPIYNGEYFETTGGDGFPQGVYPGHGDGQDQPVLYPGQPDGECCPPDVYSGPYPVPGTQQQPGPYPQGSQGSGGQGGSNTQTSVWRNGTHTRWTFHGIGSMPTNVQSRGGSSTNSRTGSQTPSGGAFQHVPPGDPNQGAFESTGLRHIPLSNQDRGTPEGGIHQNQQENRQQQQHVSSSGQFAGVPVSGFTQESLPVISGQGSQQGQQGVDVPHDTSFTTRCTRDNRGEIYHDKRTAKVYQCDGQTWRDWVVIGLQGPTRQPPESTGCPLGWHGNNARCYLMSTIETTWNEAQRICREQHDSNLVSIRSKAEQKWIASLVAGQYIWIGANDKFVEGNWEWISNDPVTYTRWKPGSPHLDEQHNINCAMVSRRMRWMDSSCEEGTNFFVCMKPSV